MTQQLPGIDAIMAKLAEPFDEREVKWRVQSTGDGQRGPWVRVLAYIDNAAVMRRLDAVVGAHNWQNRFEQLEGGVICGLSLRVGEQWITKWDGSAATQTEPFKGALSGAMKRAAVMWGIGRYLHGMGEQFAEVVPANTRGARAIKGKDFRWLPPKLDAKYLPKRSSASEQRGGAPSPMAETVAKVAPVEEPARTRAHVKMFAHPLTGRDVDWRNYPLPGTKAHLAQQGGKNLGDVPANLLPEIREKLLEHAQYATAVAAIEEAMAVHEASR